MNKLLAMMAAAQPRPRNMLLSASSDDDYEDPIDMIARLRAANPYGRGRHEWETMASGRQSLSGLQDRLTDLFAQSEQERSAGGGNSYPERVEDGRWVQPGNGAYAPQMLAPEFRPEQPLTLEDIYRLMGRRR